MSDLYKSIVDYDTGVSGGMTEVIYETTRSVPKGIMLKVTEETVDILISPLGTEDKYERLKKYELSVSETESVYRN